MFTKLFFVSALVEHACTAFEILPGITAPTIYADTYFAYSSDFSQLKF